MPLNLIAVSRIRLLLLLFFFGLTILKANAQDTTQPVELDSVVVKAFDQNSRLRNMAAAENYISNTTLRRFGSASIVDAVNTTPGIRMEERSPGSYRFSIRGSSLRSPFGVRNVKVYYNDLPLTDPSGQTYLNALGNYDYGSMEVIKGPGSSFYGAGTGGVLLINSLNENRERFFAEHTFGSYGLQNSYAAISTGTGLSQNRIAFQHQQSDGYRAQSAINRNVLNWSGQFTIGESNVLKTTFLYSDLYYQTPGALTLAEYNSDPKAARPAAGPFPSAEAAHATIYQQSFLAGASYTQQLSEHLQNKTVAYGAFTKLRNPAIRNYGRNSEPHVGGRTVFTWKQLFQKAILTANLGAEWQQGFATYSVHKNNAGTADSLQILDDVTNRQGFLFAHVDLNVTKWSVSAGGSLNQYKLQFQRYFPAPLPVQKRTFNNELAPRLSVLRKFKTFNVYSSLSKGFSSPTIAEAIPTGSAVNLDLNAEHGLNYDLGFRGTFFKTLYVDFNAFLFQLKNAIVQRRDSAGGDYYINAGSTRQKGLEVYLRHPLVNNAKLKSAIWTSYTWHHFRYKDFKQGTADFSDNKLPGVAPHTVASGIDFNVTHFAAAITYYFSSKLPLNDANTSFAKSYHLVSANVGYNIPVHAINLRIGAGVNNLLNQQYSLGNDINAAAGRYYNAAPLRNYYVSLSIQGLRKKEEG